MNICFKRYDLKKYKNFRYGLTQIPSLVFFEFRVPEMFPGDLKNDDEILEWITKELTDLDMEEVNLQRINP